MITTAIVFDHRGRCKKNDLGPLEVRVTVDRKLYYINTGIRVMKQEFCGGTVVQRFDADLLNERLQIISRRVIEEVNRCIDEGRALNATDLKTAIFRLKEMQREDDFMAWCDEQIPLLKIGEGTRRHYLGVLKRMRSFGKFQRWNDITMENIIKWDAWLHEREAPQSKAEKQMGKEKEKITDASIWNYHKRLKALLFRAEKFGRIERNPYSLMRGEFPRGDKENLEYLTEEEMKAFEALNPVMGTRLATAHDLFIFQMYTGLSYTDAQAFDLSDYKCIDGKWLNIGTRIKTGVPYVNQLLPPAVKVLEKYNWQVPKIENAKYNKTLKTLGAAAGIETRLHSHLARHTFATWMLAHGVKIENLSKMMGHTNIKQTQRYAKVLAQSVYKDFTMIANILEERDDAKVVKMVQ